LSSSIFMVFMPRPDRRIFPGMATLFDRTILSTRLATDTPKIPTPPLPTAWLSRFYGFILEDIDFLDLLVQRCYVNGMEIRLSPDQEAHLAALASSAGRSADEIVQEAVALWEERENARVLAQFQATLDTAEASLAQAKAGSLRGNPCVNWRAKCINAVSPAWRRSRKRRPDGSPACRRSRGGLGRNLVTHRHGKRQRRHCQEVVPPLPSVLPSRQTPASRAGA
jgi:predicted transcriptional regulator